MTSVLTRAADLLAHMIWPVSCPICGRAASILCDECLDGAERDGIWVCMECGIPHPCARHKGAPTCVGMTRYDAANRAIIHAMKFGGIRGIASMLGERIARDNFRPDADLLIPVPLHRDSDRGFNQAEIMARAAGERWGIPVRDALEWRTVMKRQALSSSSERVLPRYAIISKDRAPISSRACIFDDVMTTGSTLRAAAQAIKDAGGTVSGAFVWSIS